jgi:hypothetical protein
VNTIKTPGTLAGSETMTTLVRHLKIVIIGDYFTVFHNIIHYLIFFNPIFDPDTFHRSNRYLYTPVDIRLPIHTDIYSTNWAVRLVGFEYLELHTFLRVVHDQEGAKYIDLSRYYI